MASGDLSVSGLAPRRLSKPQTNNRPSMSMGPSPRHTDVMLSSADASQQDYFGDYAAVITSQEERKSRRKSRSGIRAYLRRSSNGNGQTSSDEGEFQGGHTALDMKKRLSRTGSSLVQFQSAKSSTARLSGSSSSGLLQGAVSEAEESAAVAHQIKERALHDSLAAHNHIASPANEEEHVHSIKAPVRRKSLYTPGLAGRNASDILKKPPQMDDRDDQPNLSYYYDPAKPKESPLSQLAALQILGGGRSTPSNIHYPQLGGLRLGTLRVTNGADSPTSRAFTPELVDGDDARSEDKRSTAFEGSTILGYDEKIRTREEWDLPSSTSDISTLEHPQLDDGGRLPSSIPSLTSDSATSMAHEYMTELGGGPFTSPYTPPSIEDGTQTSLNEAERLASSSGTTGNSYGVHKISSEQTGTPVKATASQHDAFRKLNGILPVCKESRKAIDTPTVHDQSINDGPLMADHMLPSDQETPSWAVERSINRTSGHNIVEGASTCAAENNYSTVHNAPYDTASQSPARSCIYRDCPACNTVAHPRPEQGIYEPHLGSLATSPHAFIDAPRGREIEAYVKTNRAEQAVMRPVSCGPLRKLQKSRRKPQNLPADIVVQGYRDLDQAQIPRVPPCIAVRHADRLHQFPLLNRTYPSTQHTNLREDDDDSADYLPIRFPSPVETNSAELSVASVKPNRFKRSYSLAVSKSRGADQVDEEELGRANIVRSPSWSNFGVGKERKEQKKLAKERKQDYRRKSKDDKRNSKRLSKGVKDSEIQICNQDHSEKTARSRSTSRARGRTSRRSSQHEMNATIADFGTVAESLGSNPYDLAIEFSNKSPASSRRHPHQMSSTQSRAKSRDNVEAAAYMSSPSTQRVREEGPRRDHEDIPREDRDTEARSMKHGSTQPTQFNLKRPIPALRAVDLKLGSHDQVRNHRRSRSVGIKSTRMEAFNDRGGLPGRSMRSEVMLSEAPPMPSLPSLHQVQQREAEITSSRPRSMAMQPPSIWSPRLTDERTSGSLDTPFEPSKSPRKPRVTDTVPGLWSNGSIERKEYRPVEGSSRKESPCVTTPDQEIDGQWAAQSQAWSQRRKSAGEALLRTQMSERLHTREETSQPTKIQQSDQAPQTLQAPSIAYQRKHHDIRYSQQPKSLSVSVYVSAQSSPQHFPPTGFGSRPSALLKRPISYHGAIKSKDHQSPPIPLQMVAAANATESARPQDAHPATAIEPSETAIRRKHIGSGIATSINNFERLSGRYEGGLLFGYEPGSGLGGSAGTRGAKTAASRKSLNVSQGYGVDLSDVPVFISPTRAY